MERPSSLNIKCKKLIFKTFIYLFVIFGVLFGCSQQTVRAAGFIDHNDSIYTEKEPETQAQDLEKAYDGEFDDAEEPGILEKALSGLVHAVGSAFHSMLKHFNLDIDTVVLGRLSYDNNEPNLLRFEFSKGNVYAIFGLKVYRTFTSIAFIVLVLMFGATAVKYMGKGTAQARQNAKGEFSGILSMFIVIALMPFIWDIAIFLRDLLMHSIKNMLSSSIGIPKLSLWDIMDYAYEQSGKGLIPASLCLGSAILTLSFIFDYLNIALSDTLLCIAFPAICLNNGEKRKRGIENWMSLCTGNLAVPVADLILIMLVSSFPLILGSGLKISIIQLILAWNIRRSRNELLSYMGIRTSQASGLGGLMGIMAAGKLLKGAINGIKSISGSVGAAYSDHKNAQIEDELDSMGTGDESQQTEKSNRYNDEEMNGVRSDGEPLDDSQEGATSDEPDEEMSDLRSDEMDGVDELDDEAVGTDIPDENKDSEDNDENSSEPLDNMSPQDEIEKLQGDNDQLAMDNQQIDRDIANANDDIHKNNREIEKLDDINQNKEKQLEELVANGEGDSDKAQRIKNDIDRNNQRIATLKGRNQDLNREIGSLQGTKLQNLQKMRGNNSKIYEQQGIIQSNSNYGSQFTNRYNPDTATPEQQRLHEIALKRANIKNFDSPQFEGMLSHKEMSDFYKKRARKQIIQAGTKTVGMAAGATLGAATMSWMGPQYMAYGAVAGLKGGEGLGTGAGELINMTVTGAKKLNNSHNAEAVDGEFTSYSDYSGREPGTENIPIKQRMAKGHEWEPVNDSNVPKFTPENIIEPIDKGGIFVNNSNSSLEERMNTSAEAVKLYDLNVERKEKMLSSLKKSIDVAIRNNEIVSDDVPEYIQRRYSGGITKLSEADQKKVQGFIDEVVDYWKNN